MSKPSPSLLSSSEQAASASSWHHQQQLQRSSSSIGSNNAIRSSPIDIAKQQECKQRSDSSNDDGDSSDDVSEEEATHHLMMVGSMPPLSPSMMNPWSKRRRGAKDSHLAKSLPAAPLLKARSDLRMDQLDIPAFTLTEAEDPQIYEAGSKTAYGSLRDSHIRGRFLDGPSSYREKGTGQIRYYMRSRSNQQVRFDDSSTSYHKQSPMFSSRVPIHDRKAENPPSSMGSWSRYTPGERMQQALEEKQSKQQGKEESTDDTSTTTGLRSSLSSLMLSAQAPGEMVDTSTSSRGDSLRHHQDHQDAEGEEMKLSASLTGFEILKRTPTLQISAVPVVQEESSALLHGQSDTVLSVKGATSEAQAMVGYSGDGQDDAGHLSGTVEIFDLDM